MVTENEMERYSDCLRRLADMLDENFDDNIAGVIEELLDTVKHLVGYLCLRWAKTDLSNAGKERL